MDLEKAFDRVTREMIRWAMHKLGDEKWLVLAVMSVYTGAKTVVRTVYGNSKCFQVKLGMHPGSVLSPLLLGSHTYSVRAPCFGCHVCHLSEPHQISKTTQDMCKILSPL